MSGKIKQGLMPYKVMLKNLLKELMVRIQM
jgi:hypothetical protein